MVVDDDDHVPRVWVLGYKSNKAQTPNGREACRSGDVDMNS